MEGRVIAGKLCAQRSRTRWVRDRPTGFGTAKASFPRRKQQVSSSSETPAPAQGKRPRDATPTEAFKSCPCALPKAGATWVPL